MRIIMSNSPSSLLHYTSMHVLNILLEGAINSYDPTSGTEPMLTFHASIGYAMNDRVEGKLFFDYFFTGSTISNEIAQKLESIKKDKGEVFIISLSHSHEGTPNGEIPMWMMYGDNGNGVLLRFDFKRLLESVKQQMCSIEKIEYKNNSEIKKIAEEKRAIMKKEMKEDLLNAIFKESFLYKDIHWNYEDEYRIIKQEKTVDYKNGKYGIVAYSKIQIPLSCLNGITIGPLAHQDIVQQSLASYIEKIRGIYPSFNCKVYNSQIEIR